MSNRMTTGPHLPATGSDDSGDSLSTAQKEVLQRGVAKIVAWGAQIGVTTDPVIELLKAWPDCPRIAGVPGGTFGRSGLKSNSLTLKPQKP
jgi:hypothetical protein